MPDFKQRSMEQEIMDDLDCKGSHVEQTLREIRTVNRLLGGYKVTIHALDQFLNQGSISRTETLRIADLGCGGGDTLQAISRWAKKNHIKVALTGIDANPNIIHFAREQCANDPSISFETRNVFDESFWSGRQDIYICTLFLHHFSDDQITWLLEKMNGTAGIGVVVNDLERHPLAYYSISLLAKLISRSPMFRYDAPLSVLRGFKRKDLLRFISDSRDLTISLNWFWAFRWQMIFIKKPHS